MKRFSFFLIVACLLFLSSCSGRSLQQQYDELYDQYAALEDKYYSLRDKYDNVSEWCDEHNDLSYKYNELEKEYLSVSSDLDRLQRALNKQETNFRIVNDYFTGEEKVSFDDAYDSMESIHDFYIDFLFGDL